MDIEVIVCHSSATDVLADFKVVINTTQWVMLIDRSTVKVEIEQT